jgi:cation:H+ antiporter
VTLANALGLLLGGLILLAGGGEALVRGATAIARRAGVTPAVIGLTIVAAGTSLPELVVSVLAALGGEPEIAVGNVVGSNIFNILGVLGITAIVTRLPVHGSSVKYEWPFMFLVSCLVVVVAHDGEISRLEGAMLLAGFGLFTGFMLQVARREVAAEERAALAMEVRHRTIAAPEASFALSAVAVVVGVLLLVLGGSALVSGAVELARIAGISERVIGLTVVAIGTSMPELAASVVAALRGHTDVAIANLIGSNIFNILGILGTTALVRPTPVTAAMLNSDMTWMMCSAFALFPIMRTGMRVSRLEGVLLLALYAAYLFTLLR